MGWRLIHVRHHHRLVEHAERVQIRGQDRLFFLAVVAALFPELQDLAHRRHIEAHRLGVRELVAEILGERLRLLLEPFDLFDELAKMVLRGLRQSGHENISRGKLAGRRLAGRFSVPGCAVWPDTSG